MSGWQKAMIFVWGSIVGGMAFAFLAVVAAAQWRPELLTALRLGKPPQAPAEIVLPDAPSPGTSMDGKPGDEAPKDIILPPRRSQDPHRRAAMQRPFASPPRRW